MALLTREQVQQDNEDGGADASSAAVLLFAPNLPADVVSPIAPGGAVQVIGEGTAGIADTLDYMVRLTREARTDYTFRRIADQIIARVPNKQYMGEAEAVRAWVMQNIRYTQDPDALEMVKRPIVTLMSRNGDCDDHAVLVGVLMRAIGYPVRYVAVGTNDAGVFEHVYAEARLGHPWVAMETTEDVALGWTPQPQLSRMVRNV